MKLALGTAQIGLDYGVSNQRGQVSRDEAAKILRAARAAGITMLDTAVSYGDSESRLGEIGVHGLGVVSKLPSVPEDTPDIQAWMAEIVRGSLERLRIDRLYGLLLHRPQQLREKRGREISAALVALVRTGLVQKTGVSIYVPSELQGIAEDDAVGLVQAPLNFFDDRLVRSGWLSRLKGRSVEVHVRSIFLQGVLLFGPDQRPKRFDRWAHHFATYDAWMRTHDCSRLQACVGYAMSIPEVDRIVVGVESATQLDEIVVAARMTPPVFPAELSSSDTELLDPLVWMRR